MRGSGGLGESSMGEKGSTGTVELTRLAYIQLKKGNSKRAMEYFENAAEKARQEGDTYTVTSCYLNAGAGMISQGQLKEGTEFLQSALKLVKAKHLDQGKRTASVSGREPTEKTLISADVYYNLAVAAERMNDYKQAISYLKTSINLYLRAGSIPYVAGSFVSLAGCHRKMGEAEKEVACLAHAQKLYHDLSDDYNEAETCIDLARSYFREGKMEECRELSSTVKMLCWRVDDCTLQGKLYSRLGLLHTSLGQFDLGIQYFEQAVPLIRRRRAMPPSDLQMEASLLQNIGAAYNEKKSFSEAIIYHKEAAAIQGRVKNYNSESKCLCNLAFAQTQLKQLQEAEENFNKALDKARLANNSYLQFQACEGLGSIHLKMESCIEAVHYFEQALGILDQIKEDSGIARERVTEKLSEATECLMKVKQAKKLQRVKGKSRARLSSKARVDDTKKDSGSIFNKEDDVFDTTRRLTRSLGAEFSNAEVDDSGEKPEYAKKRSITERRGVESLPPIRASTEGSKVMKPTRKHVVVAIKKGKEKMVGNGGNKDLDDNYLQAYVDSYRDSVTSSSQESPTPATHTQNNLQKLSLPLSSAQRPSARTPTNQQIHFIPQGYVREGSLAIGLNARENFIVRRAEEHNPRKGKRRHHTKNDIIIASPGPHVIPSDNGGKNPKQQSKICTIL